MVSYKKCVHHQDFCVLYDDYVYPWCNMSVIPTCEQLIYFIVLLITGGLGFSSSEIGTSLLCAAIPLIILVFLMARVS